MKPTCIGQKNEVNEIHICWGEKMTFPIATSTLCKFLFVVERDQIKSCSCRFKMQVLPWCMLWLCTSLRATLMDWVFIKHSHYRKKKKNALIDRCVCTSIFSHLSSNESQMYLWVLIRYRFFGMIHSIKFLKLLG